MINSAVRGCLNVLACCSSLGVRKDCRAVSVGWAVCLLAGFCRQFLPGAFQSASTVMVFSAVLLSKQSTVPWNEPRGHRWRGRVCKVQWFWVITYFLRPNCCFHFMCRQSLFVRIGWGQGWWKDKPFIQSSAPSPRLNNRSTVCERTKKKKWLVIKACEKQPLPLDTWSIVFVLRHGWKARKKCLGL